MKNWEHADELVDLIAEGRSTGPDEYALLQEVYAGFPLDRLKPLVRSGETRAVRVAATILAEAGPSVVAAPTLLRQLLGNEDPKVRYYAVQAVLGSGSPSLGQETATSITLLDDVERGVRRSALRLLAYAPTPQLEAAVPFLTGVWAQCVRDLTAGTRANEWDPSQVGDSRRVVGLIQLAAAIREADTDASSLERFAQDPDREIRDFARIELELIR